MKCEACRHDKQRRSIKFTCVRDYWKEVEKVLGHVCNDITCPHTCDIGDFNYEVINGWTIKGG